MPWKPAPSDSDSWNEACASPGGYCGPGTDPKTTRLGFLRASEPLLEPLGQEARPIAHFRVAGCWCPLPFPVVSEAGDLLQGQEALWGLLSLGPASWPGHGCRMSSQGTS